MTEPSLTGLVRHARAHSPFYRALYTDVPAGGPRPLAELPVVDHTRFRAANTLRDNRVLTAPMTDGIVAGDRVANLFYAGELYASFLFNVLCLQRSRVPTLQLPLGGDGSLDALRELEATVLMGAPTTLCRLADQAVSLGDTLPRVHLFLFAGEAFYDDRRPLLGAPVADDGVPVGEPGRPGALLVTDLTRRLMPAGVQLVQRRRAAKDELVLRIAGHVDDEEAFAKAVADRFDQVRPMFAEHVRTGAVQPLAVEFVSPGDLAVNQRTGKTPRLLDERTAAHRS